MDKIFFEKLEAYSKAAIEFAKMYFDLNELVFDHICYQTTSKEDHSNVMEQLQSDVDLIGEIPHAGRMLALARLKNPIKVGNVIIDLIEVAQPKPKKIVQARNFDHFAFMIKGDFEKAVNNLRKKEAKISEIKQILDHKFLKCIDEKTEVEIEFRNKKLEEAVGKGPLKSRKTRGGASIIETIKNRVVKDKTGSRLQKHLEDERERKLRAIADYQNLQKRFAQERKKITVLANAIILGQLLDILDDFDRTLQNLKIDEKDQVGIRLVRDKLVRLIDSNGLVGIKRNVGEKFDPNMCEAVGVVAVTKDEEDNTIREVVQKGYVMKEGEQLVRPVKVIVGRKGD